MCGIESIQDQIKIISRPSIWKEYLFHVITGNRPVLQESVWPCTKVDSINELTKLSHNIWANESEENAVPLKEILSNTTFYGVGSPFGKIFVRKGVKGVSPKSATFLVKTY